MKLGIMQPYVFPYIGYYQLVNAVDRFVFLDDVNFINRGWINRNNILVNGKASLFTIPLQSASQNRLINEIPLAEGAWRDKTIRTIEMAYKKAPQFASVFPLIAAVLSSSETYISALAKQSIKTVCAYLGVQTPFIESSESYQNKYLKGDDRILHICQTEQAADYINPIGGTELYHKEKFRAGGVNLHFLKAGTISYPQFNNEFVPFLSIIDVLMFNEKEAVQQYLGHYQLVN